MDTAMGLLFKKNTYTALLTALSIVTFDMPSTRYNGICMSNFTIFFNGDNSFSEPDGYV